MTTNRVNKDCVDKDFVNKDCVYKDCVNKDCVNKDCVNKDCVNKDCVNKTSTITYLGFLKWLKFPSLELDLKLAHVTNVTSNRVNKDFTNISNWQLC